MNKIHELATKVGAKVLPEDDYRRTLEIADLETLLSELRILGRSRYNGELDAIVIPFDRDDLKVDRNLSNELAHELVHWTIKRVGRAWPDSRDALANEEVIAQTGARLLTEKLGLETWDDAKHHDYINSWLKVASKPIRYLEAEAAKAVEYLLQRSHQHGVS